MNKIGCPTYFRKNKYYLKFSVDAIDGEHGLPLDSHDKQ